MDDVDRTYESRKLVYQELCNSYRAIDNFRSALLGLLPLASGAGIFLLVRSDNPHLGQTVPPELLFPIGLFGLLVTIGLFLFEIHGTYRCTVLINKGKELERQLGIEG